MRSSEWPGKILNFYKKEGDSKSTFYSMQNECEGLCENLESSSRYQSLNGTWDFKYFEAWYLMEEPVHFTESIQVPSNWQMYGYDIPYYTMWNLFISGRYAAYQITMPAAFTADTLKYSIRRMRYI